MLKRLRFSVTFPTTNRSFNQDITFDRGMTAIVGPNEAGKSLILEMARYCLFGTAALRGTADDYKTLRAGLLFEVRGESYDVSRSARSAELRRGDELLATGTKPVNARILAILGFDLQVFDVACACNQGDVEKLAEMGPAERKRMVDRLIGADRVEEFCKWTGDEALMLSREIAGLERGLVEPTFTPKPHLAGLDGQQLREGVTALREKQKQLFQLQAFLRTEPVQPAQPVSPHTFKRVDLEAALDLLRRPVYDFDLAEAQAAQVAWDRWEERRRFLRRVGPRPTLTRQQCADLIEIRDIEAELTRLATSPVIECPCGKPFTTADGRIAELKARLGQIPVVKGIYDPAAELRQIQVWEQPDTLQHDERTAGAVEVPEPVILRHDLIQAETAGIHAAELRSRLGQLGLSDATAEGVRAYLQLLNTYEAQAAVYDEKLAVYRAWQEQAKTVRAAVTLLEPAVAELPALEQKLHELITYEAEYGAYQQARTRYTDLLEVIETKTAERDSWLAGKQAFQQLRTTIKTHLVPSLSLAASRLLSHMTGGARNTIVVDEEFEITVDGQPLATLSGSGRACANLALRIGLGQVLTNNVFSVFVGDEMDASMDAERAANLATSLGMLRSRVSQILVVTHKTPSAEAIIRLGNTGAEHGLYQGSPA